MATAHLIEVMGVGNVRLTSKGDHVATYPITQDDGPGPTDLCGSSPYIKGEPTAIDAARLRRSLTDEQKVNLRAHLRVAIKGRAAVLNPPAEADA